MVIILVSLLASLVPSSVFAAETHPLLATAPKNATKKLEASADGYKNLKVSGRCAQADGPKDFQTFLEVKKAGVLAFDAWTGESQNLVERVVIQNGSKTELLTFTQDGCSHFGWTFKVLSSLPIDKKSTAKSVKSALSRLNQIQAKGIFVSKSLPIGADVLRVLAARVSKGNKKLCRYSEKPEHSNASFLCGVYEDPSNYELSMEELPDGKTELVLNFWYVL